MLTCLTLRQYTDESVVDALELGESVTIQGLKIAITRLTRGKAQSCLWRHKGAILRYFTPFMAESMKRIALQSTDEDWQDDCFSCFAGAEGVEELKDVGIGIEQKVKSIIER